MPDVPTQAHARLIATLQTLQRDVCALRDTSEIKDGYSGFDIAENTLIDLRAAISAVRDRDMLVTWLKMADGIFQLTGGGAAAPVAAHIRATLKAAREKFEGRGPPRRRH